MEPEYMEVNPLEYSESHRGNVLEVVGCGTPNNPPKREFCISRIKNSNGKWVATDFCDPPDALPLFDDTGQVKDGS